MPKIKQCALCKETKSEYFRTINETSKGKAEGGGCFELNIGDSLCTKCYTSKVQWDRNIKYQRHRLNTSQETYLPTTKKLRKELNKLNTNISSSSEIIDLQNEIDNLKNSIDNLKQEMESITRPSVDKIKGNCKILFKNYFFVIVNFFYLKKIFKGN